MKEKKSTDFKSPFDDRDLPISDLSVERTEEIERIVMPKLQASFDKLRLEKSHLFNSSKKK